MPDDEFDPATLPGFDDAPEPDDTEAACEDDAEDDGEAVPDEPFGGPLNDARADA